jgi:hypothetical protein
MDDDENPHDIIKYIGKPKQWRERASIILIKLWEDRRYNKWLISALFALDVFVAALLLQQIFA